MSEISSTPSRPATPVTAQHAQHPPAHPARPYRFTWDPSLRKAGPQSVSGTTEGRGGAAGDYFSYNQPMPTPFPLGVLGSSMSTTTLSLGALPTEWSSSKHGFHAISTVLNHPNKKQAPPKPHSSLPTVPPADLPRVRRKDFDSYLRAIQPEWEKFERNNRIGREGQAQLTQSQEDDSTPRASITSDATGAEEPLNSSSLTTTGPVSTTYRNTPLTPIQPKTIPPLDSVPTIFFDPSFNLADPRTFASVTEQSPSSDELITPTSFDTTDNLTPSTHAPSLSLPPIDKLSHYADTVEQHLVREISLRSTSFFAALTNLQDLQAESDMCLDRIAKLRGLLKDVDEKTALRGLEVVGKEEKWEWVEKVRESVRGVRAVVEMTGVARGLVSAGQWGEALDVVEELERMWEGHKEGEGTGKRVESLENGNAERLAPLKEEEEREHEQEAQQTKPILEFPLSVVNAFSELPKHLRELTLDIAMSLSQELVVLLRHDLEQRTGWSAGHDQDGGDVKPNGSSRPDHSKRDEELKDKLKMLLRNLLRTKGLKNAILGWRDVVFGEVKSVVRRAVPGFEKEWEEEKDDNRTGLVQYLKNMQHQEFMPILQNVYLKLLVLIEGVHAQNTIINELLLSLSTVPSTSRSEDLSEDLVDLLTSCTSLSHSTCSKLLSIRTEPHALLPLSLFFTLHTDSTAFVVRTEVLCRRMVIGLRGLVIKQASAYLAKFHQGRVERCAKAVEDEMWNQVEVGREVQSVVDVIVGCAVADAEELLIKVEGCVFGEEGKEKSKAMNGVNGSGRKQRPLPPTKSYAELMEKGGSIVGGTAKSSPNKSSMPKTAGSGAKHLKIEDRSYYLVAATAEVLILLVDYLKIVVNLSTLTKETIAKVIEFLMTFNSRTCQLVLGAGAMRSAGLKHITAKHLSLASQSLSIVSELIPYVRETFRRHLNQTEAVLLVDFDKLKRTDISSFCTRDLGMPPLRDMPRLTLHDGSGLVLVDEAVDKDYQVHQTEIHAKLISIMGDRLTEHISSLQAIDWSQPNANSGGVNAYMQTLVKETTTLHKVLSRYLTPALVEYVMTEVFAGINHRLSEVYGKIELPNPEAKARLLADAKYLNQELSGLRNVTASMGMLETVVSEKQMPRVNVVSPTPTPTPTRSATLSANQRLKGLLSRRSIASANAADNIVPSRTSTSTPPPPPLPTKSPLDQLNPNAVASLSTLNLASSSSLTLDNAGADYPPPPLERAFSASPPPMNGHVSGKASTERNPQSPAPERRTGSPSLQEVQSQQHRSNTLENGLTTAMASPHSGSSLDAPLLNLPSEEQAQGENRKS